MTQKLLKTKKTKIAPKKDAVKKTSIVLVGTYNAAQMKKWILPKGYYNYPVGKDDDCTPEHCKRIKELWLYKGKSERKVFSAEFLGVKTRTELPDYPATKTKPHGEKYLLFKVTELYGPQLENATVHVRVSDFTKRTPKIAAAIKAFQEGSKAKPKSAKHLQALGAAGILAEVLPNEIAQVPPERLCIREAAVQLDFLGMIFPNTELNNKTANGTIEYICKRLGCIHGKPGWPDEFGVCLRRFFDQNSTHRIRTLSLFSGAGGLDIGFSDAGFDIVDSVEIEKKFCATLELNSGVGKRFEHSKVNCIDIREFSGRELGCIDFIIGGPPCQTFSAAGRRANGVLGMTDARGVLFREYVRLLNELHPRGFLFENVYGLTGAQGGKAWREIQDSFAEAGYTIYSRILDAADFGVPQHRERLIIVGLQTGCYKFPRPTHGPDSIANTPFYTAGTAISGLRLTDDEKKSGLGGRFGHLLDEIPPGLNYSYYTKEMGHPKPVFAWRSKFSDFLYKADPAAPVRTIKAQGGAYTGPLHWANRFFACSEYKRLQTFPDNYEISGGKQVAVKQIGNSVPPQLARMLAISIQDQLFGVEFPFQLNYLTSEDKLSFRSRKLSQMDNYRKKARAEISCIHQKGLPCKPFNSEFFCRISDRFKFDKCEPRDGDYRITVKWGDELRIEVLDFGQSLQAKICFTIEIIPSRMTWDLPFSKIIMKSHSARNNSFTIAWKALENIIASRGLKADLVQMNGYYQYRPELCSRCRFSVPFKYSDVITRIVSGENVRKIVSGAELARSWGISQDNVLDVAIALRSIGYEIRNNKTNPQIEPGQWLIPYAFPTLNHMSVQLGKEIR